MSDGIRCMVMRGGTSKGAYFVADELPEDVGERDALLARVMGSPDPRQIDGIGGAHPLTSKVAVVSRSGALDADVDYLFLQVGVDDGLVSDGQNCGNLLAGVGQFALERGLIEYEDVLLGDRREVDGSGRDAGGVELAQLWIRMVNSDSVATATFPVCWGAASLRGGRGDLWGAGDGGGGSA